MFHFPALPPNWLYIHQQVTRHHSRRVSPFGHPRIHARLTAPRGISQPPTSFIGSQCQGIHHAPLNTYNTKNQNGFELKNSEIAHQHTDNYLRVRCSQPLSTSQTPHPTTNVERQPSPIPGFPHSGQRDSGPVASKPNSVSGNPHRTPRKIPGPVAAHRLLLHPNPHPLQAGPLSRTAQNPNPHTMWAGLSLVVLLRKEVIQPHLPVRLPCYDFVPIADPTFDGSPPSGLGHRLRVLPTFMT